MTDTKSTIEKLNELGIIDVSESIQYSLNNEENINEENIKSAFEILNKYGWKYTKSVNDKGCFTIRAESIVDPSVEFVNELKTLGVDTIIETLYITVYKKEHLKPMQNIIIEDDWGLLSGDREFTPLSVWHFKTCKVYNLAECEN